MSIELKDLLKFGYFPTRELPPCFTTNSFADFYVNNKAKVSKIKKTSDCVIFTTPKVGIDRKILKVPNPLFYARLCDLVCENWNYIDIHLGKCNNSYSKPILNKDFIKNPLKVFRDFANDSFINSAGFSHFLKTDISKFYQSIYTHTIAWALDGKDKAKEERTLEVKSLGSRIDNLVRYLQDSQSIGIPIGPYASLIVSEIINAKIDDELKTRLDVPFYQVRFIDDRNLYFKSRADVEKAIIILQAILREYQLTINIEKTEVQEIPNISIPEWLIKLRNFNFRLIQKKDGESDDDFFKRLTIVKDTDYSNYFNLIYILNKSSPKEYVFKYAIRHIQHHMILKGNWELVESQLIKSALKEPSILPDVIQFFLRHNKFLNKDRLLEFANLFLSINVEKSFDYETIWALWFIKVFDLKVNEYNCPKLISINDSFSRLLVLDLMKNKQLELEVDFSDWVKNIDSNDLLNNSWLFVYEIGIQKFLLKEFEYINSVEGNDFYKKLLDNNVSFFNSEYQYDIEEEPEEVEYNEYEGMFDFY